MGTGKFSSHSVMADAIVAGGSHIVTAALRRVDLQQPKDAFLDAIAVNDTILLTNTSGARTAAEAIRLARLGGSKSPWVKLEVTPEPNHLLPDTIETVAAAAVLVKEGFIVLPYIHADPVACKRLEDVGCPAVMPLGAPIGTNRGLATRDQLRIIVDQSSVPVIVDAGLGAPSHASEAMEMGADAVLVNTAIATARDPVAMARAFKWAVDAGRLAYVSGVAGERLMAAASSPLTGFLR
jgi:thiazole synthase